MGGSARRAAGHRSSAQPCVVARDPGRLVRGTWNCNPPGMLLTILIVLLLLAALGGGFGYSRYGYGSWSPAAIVVVILIIMLLSGRL